jgi:hypothetical protein
MASNSDNSTVLLSSRHLSLRVWVAVHIYHGKTGRQPMESTEFLWGQGTINIELRILSEVQGAIHSLVDGFKHLYGKNVFAYARKLESASPGVSVKTQPLRFLLLRI